MGPITDMAGYFGGPLATSISSYIGHAVREMYDMMVPKRGLEEEGALHCTRVRSG